MFTSNWNLPIQISSTDDGTTRTSTYKINVNKSPPGGSVILMITFSHPVNTSTVTVSGDVRFISLFKVEYVAGKYFFSPP